MRLDLPKALTFIFIGLSLLALMLGKEFFVLSLPSFLPLQLLTFPFVSLSGFVGTIFTAFCLWLSLSTLLIRLTEKQLLLLFLSATLFIGSATFALLQVTTSPFILAGPTALIYALLTTLLLSDRHLKILLLGLVPVEPRVLVVVLLGLNTIHLLSQENYMQIAANFSGVLYAFVYTPLLKKFTQKTR